MSHPHKAMSMEAALEEERREVEALIAARNRPRPPSALSGARSSSPFTPRSPVRSMLDIGENDPFLHGQFDHQQVGQKKC
jgi:hypothetical protein